MTIRHTLIAIAATLFLPVGLATAAEPPPPVVKVWKSPSCGCCGKWVRHMEAAGFRVEVTDVADVDPVKKANGLPLKFASCHTALVGGYVIEGHVPADEVRRLLKEKPAILGLAAPGMPAGSPGMDVPGSPAWNVLRVGRDGSSAVWSAEPPTR